jgi:hypothetical protein
MEPRGVVRVSVGDAQVIAGQHLLGCLADVEAHVQLGRGDDRLLAGDGVTQEQNLPQPFFDKQRRHGPNFNVQPLPPPVRAEGGYVVDRSMRVHYI